jgi:hypothetical protein
MPRVGAVALVVFCAAGLTALAWKCHREESRPPLHPASVPPAPHAAESPSIPSETPERAPETGVGIEKPEPASEDDTASAGALVHGHLDVYDSAGVRHETTNGWWGNEHALGESAEALSSRVAVHGGEFSTHDYGIGHVDPEIAELDGRLAWFESSWVAVPESGPLTLTAHWAEPLVLEVADKASGAELDDVTVLRAVDDRFFDDIHPGDRRRTAPIVEHAQSPFRLLLTPAKESVRWRESVWIGARDHAWQCLSVDYRLGGNHRCELESGADLEVRVDGERPEIVGPSRIFREAGFKRESSLPRVRVRTPVEEVSEDDEIEAIVGEARKNFAKMRDDEFPNHHRMTEEEIRAKAKEWVAERRASRGLGRIISDAALVLDPPTELRGLPAGEWLVTVETGDASDRPGVWGRSSVRLEAGRRTTVTIVLASPSSPTAAQEVPLAGSIEQSPEWGVRAPRLEFKYAKAGDSSDDESIETSGDEIRADASRPGHFAFDLGLVKPGRYVVRNFARGFEQVVDTGPSGNRDVRIVIGDPAVLVLRPVDAKTGAAMPFLGSEAPRVSWEAARQTDVRNDKVQFAKWDEALGVWTLRAASGEITVMLQSPKFDGHSHILLVPGNNEAQLPIEPRCGIELYFEVDGRRIEAPGELWRRIQVASSDGTRVEHQPWVGRDEGTILVLREPGEVEVTFPEIPAFERPEPFKASVGRGEWVEHVVKLVRRH